VLAVRLQEIRDWHPTSVREVAGRWEQGLRGLLGLAGISGLVGAPVAGGRLSELTQMLVGVLLGLVLLVAGTGLILTMSAAYGSVRLVQAPRSLTEFQRLLWSRAKGERRRFLWGRGLAIGALVLLAVTVALAWINPTSPRGSRLRVETNAGTVYCGKAVHAPHGTIAIDTDAGGRQDIPAADVAAVDTVDACDEAGH
jgi:hypothetical protein